MDALLLFLVFSSACVITCMMGRKKVPPPVIPMEEVLSWDRKEIDLYLRSAVCTDRCWCGTYADPWIDLNDCTMTILSRDGMAHSWNICQPIRERISD